jgi:hypothetical protein
MFTTFFRGIGGDNGPAVPEMRSMDFKVALERELEGSQMSTFGLMAVYYAIFNDKSEPIDFRRLLPFKEMVTELGTPCNREIKRC